MFEDMINEFSTKNYFRIYGHILGTTQDIIALLYALEKNYRMFLAYENMIVGNIQNNCQLILTKEDYDKHYEMQNIMNLRKHNLEDEYLYITKINFNSPGFWEVLGNCNPLR